MNAEGKADGDGLYLSYAITFNILDGSSGYKFAGTARSMWGLPICWSYLYLKPGQ